MSDSRVIREAWERALELWGVAIRLRPPKRIDRHVASHWKGAEPLAFVSLKTRQVEVNFPLLDKLGASGSLEALFAHEIGHHIKFPHTLGMAAHLWVMQDRLLPGSPAALLNLFFDLQVNEEVGRIGGQRLIDQLVAIYRGYSDGRGGATKVNPLHEYYLAIYEELWGLTLLSDGIRQAMEEEYPGFRGDARMFAQTFWNLGDPYLQFAYALSRFARYLQRGKKKRKKRGERGGSPDPEASGQGTGESDDQSGSKAAGQDGGKRAEHGDKRMPLSGDVQAPDADAMTSALSGSPSVERAIGEATARGWLGASDAAEAADTGKEDPLAVLARMAGAPGSAIGPFRQRIVSRHYGRLVERHLFDVPLAESDDAPEETLPTVTSPWQAGDDVRGIDWTASVMAAGALAGAMPLRRDYEVDEPLGTRGKLPAIEIFLDTSGSMPDPARLTNVMTLAAQILATATIRQGGKVRGAIYSGGDPLVGDWMRSEDTAREFFLHYVGGGTRFPFELLREWAEDEEGTIRVVLSDGDFIANVDHDDARAALAWSVERSAPFVAMLRLSGGERAALMERAGPATRSERWRLVEIDALDDFASMAVELSAALFDGVRLRS